MKIAEATIYCYDNTRENTDKLIRYGIIKENEMPDYSKWECWEIKK